jgi:hypothetical protein
MKRALLLPVAYYLYFQAALGVLSICGRPEHMLILLPLSALCGWGGYSLIQYANRKPPVEPVPETNRLDQWNSDEPKP